MFGEIVNPFKKFRIENYMTVEELENSFSETTRRPLDKHTIIDLEEYKYSIVTVKVHDAYLSVFPEYETGQVMRDYYQQKAAIRTSIKLDEVNFATWKTGHPLYHYIKQIDHTIETFADLIKIRKENLDNLSGPNIPDIVKKALLECGMSQEDVDTLSRMTNLYSKGELPVMQRTISHFDEIV